MKFTRRELLWLSGGCGASRLLGAQAAGVKPEPLFVEVPTSSSGIEWTHDNAMSPEHYLPETMGPGCAFLDYDNDGWMDIYLVNSGANRLLEAAEAGPERAVQKQPRRHVHRCDRKGGRGGRHVRHGRRGRRLRQRRLPRSCSSPLMADAFCTATTATARSPT